MNIKLSPNQLEQVVTNLGFSPNSYPRVLQILENTKKRLTDYQHWTQRAFARDSSHKSLFRDKGDDLKSGVCWCLCGAIIVESDDVDYSSYTTIFLSKILFVTNNWGYYTVPSFNDNVNHADIIFLLDIGIEAIKRMIIKEAKS